MQHVATQIAIDDSVADYILALVEATRHHPAVRLGVSPRGARTFLAVTRGRALLHGRDFVTPDDVKTLAVPALAHRLLLHRPSQPIGSRKVNVVQEILQQVVVPR